MRGTINVLKRVLVQAAAFNIGLLLRELGGWSKPRQAPPANLLLPALYRASFAPLNQFQATWNEFRNLGFSRDPDIRMLQRKTALLKSWSSATAC